MVCLPYWAVQIKCDLNLTLDRLKHAFTTFGRLSASHHMRERTGMSLPKSLSIEPPYWFWSAHNTSFSRFSWSLSLCFVEADRKAFTLYVDHGFLIDLQGRKLFRLSGGCKWAVQIVRPLKPFPQNRPSSSRLALTVRKYSVQDWSKFMSPAP